MVIVRIPHPLRSYTGQRSEVSAEGVTLASLLDDLDRKYPGIRFRMIDEQGGIRPHIRLFVNHMQENSLKRTLAAGDEVDIICALSGGSGR